MLNNGHMVECPVSGDQAVERPGAGDYVEYNCPVCGTFRIGRTVLTLEPQRPTLQLALEVAKGAASPFEVPLISNVVSG